MTSLKVRHAVDDMIRLPMKPVLSLPWPKAENCTTPIN